MPSWIVVLLAAVAAVGLLVLGLSLTLIFKGHHIDSEIATNANMRRLGIKCAVQEAREAEGLAACSGSASDPHAAGMPGGCSGNCSSCDIPTHEA